MKGEVVSNFSFLFLQETLFSRFHLDPAYTSWYEFNCI
jgi:hypothetical protein